MKKQRTIPLGKRFVVFVLFRSLGSNHDFRDHQQQRNRSVNADGVTRGVCEAEPLMHKGCDQMNEHVREAKGVTSDHPVPVPDDTFLFDLDEIGRAHV